MTDHGLKVDAAKVNSKKTLLYRTELVEKLPTMTWLMLYT